MNSGYSSKISKGGFEDVYHKPLPIDTINRFWGVDSRILKHDDTVQKQSFDQGYKNFWSFVDFNANFEKLLVQSNGNNTMNSKGSNMSQYSNTNSNKLVSSNTNNSGFSYSQARKRADELAQTVNK